MIALQHETLAQMQLAKPLGITRQAFQARLNSAGYAALKEALWAFEKRDYAIKDIT